MVVQKTRTGYTILQQQNPEPADIPAFCQPGFLFNEPSHLCQQLDGQFQLLSVLNQHTGLADARCAFFVRSAAAVSPGAAPFGSVEFTETLPDLVLDALLASLTETARIAGATTVRLVNYPHCYAPEQAARLTAKVLEQGFQLIEENPTFFLPVSDQPFDHNIVPAERRRLRKCQKAGFRFEQLLPPSINTIVRFVQETRRRQGYQLPIATDHLARLLLEFPDKFPVFAVYDGLILAALLIAVRVRKDILYSFLPASHGNYRTFSPMVMLIDGLFTYCQQQGIRLFDLGVSLDGAHNPKPSLIRFKQNLGAQASPKLVFEKHL